MEKDIKRKFESVEGKSTWMLYDVDDLLYGMLQYLATYDPNNDKLYITKKNYTSRRQEIMDIAGINTTKTLSRHLDSLIEKELIKPFTLKIWDKDKSKDYECYEIVQHKEIFGKYIHKDWLYYLLNTRSKQALKVYIYLLDKFEWFEKDKPNENFIFTNKNIMEALGYSADSSSASKAITNILNSLKREKIIDFSSYYETSCQESTGNIYTTHKMKLFKVARCEEDLKE